jgi:hypothetical protein
VLWAYFATDKVLAAETARALFYIDLNLKHGHGIGNSSPLPPLNLEGTYFYQDYEKYG